MKPTLNEGRILVLLAPHVAKVTDDGLAQPFFQEASDIGSKSIAMAISRHFVCRAMSVRDPTVYARLLAVAAIAAVLRGEVSAGFKRLLKRTVKEDALAPFLEETAGFLVEIYEAISGPRHRGGRRTVRRTTASKAKIKGRRSSTKR